MKTINEYCSFLLNSPRLIDKLTPPPSDLVDEIREQILPEIPAREALIRISEEKSKIPRLEHLNQTLHRAIAIHHFANHELLALEIFAYALLKFQNIGSVNRKNLFLTLLDEQKHLQLYINRIRELGLDFGDKPLNGIFWKFLPKMGNFEKFSAVMSMSFEGANLDFAVLYRNTFEKFGDMESSRIMDIVYHDELKHVRRGYKVIEENLEQGESDWEHYLRLLEYPFTPRRAKGYFYIPFTRRKVGFSEEFIESLGKYRDEFSNRKKEIIPPEILEWDIYSG